MILIGDKQRFAAEVGENRNGLRQVDLWLASQRLTQFDNNAYVPQFLESIRHELARLRSGEDFSALFPGLTAKEMHVRLKATNEWQRCGFMDWGPTTDDITSYVFREGGDLLVTADYSQDANGLPTKSAIFVTRMPEEELLSVLEQLFDVLKAPPAESRNSPL